MQRIATLYIDHIGWGSMDEPKTISFFEKLGFYMADGPKDETKFEMSHFYMDSGSAYLEVYALQKDGTMWPVDLDLITSPEVEPLFNPRGMTGVYSFVLSTRDCDASREALVKAGYKTGPVYRRGKSEDYTYYASIGGSSTTDMFSFERGTEPFPDMLFGVMQHTNDYHTHHYRKTVHEYHSNGVNKVGSVVLYYETPEKLLSALKELHKIQDAIADYADHANYTSTVRLVDKAAYEKEFGVDAPQIVSAVAAVEFQNGDLDYILEQVKANGFSYFEKNGKLYVDGREATSTFLIFS